MGYSLGTGSPVGGADLAVLVGELDGLEDAEGLLDGASNGEVINGGRADDAVGIHDEEAAKGDGLVMEDPEGAAHLLVQVGDEGHLEGCEATLLAGLPHPGQVAVLRVDGDSVDLGAELGELGGTVVEGRQLGRADKRATQNLRIADNALGTSRGGRRGGWCRTRGGPLR